MTGLERLLEGFGLRMGREVEMGVEVAAALNLVLDFTEERRMVLAAAAEGGGGGGGEGGEQRGGVAEM